MPGGTQIIKSFGIDIYFILLNIYSNCPGSIVRESVGMALLALSQFCRFNGKIDKKAVKNNRLFLYVDVFYIKYLLL